ncbi:LemA family protein [Novosphingobium album (ex Liu et al. 2023)]|uniref:LemA family protein n=1 Tax=Novosphingobium album (ex Liu et al. 2023) TaxID=3031130 RepID=A0ABT5WWV9_9SPHN|nr:LemA family protein [Novosphingobium album (ex Liu et al. 2023)]MDE8654395.1 LemA family protein [Novosphingobium album (ex Liu et al. 2023)]
MSTIIVLVVLAVIAMVLIGIYNRLVALRQTCRQGVADIDAQLRQRHDLVPNLVATVKGYATHEKTTLDSVIEARNRATASPSPDSEAQFKVSLDRLLALGEAYPDLKANANFQALQGELADIEDKLAAARRALNAAVSRYNAGIESFPAVLFAGALGFRHEDFNGLDASEKGVVDQVPQVQF